MKFSGANVVRIRAQSAATDQMVAPAYISKLIIVIVVRMLKGHSDDFEIVAWTLGPYFWRSVLLMVWLQ